MKRNKLIKIGAYALAGAVLCGALVYYNFVEEETVGAMLYDECPDFSLDTVYGVKDGQFAITNKSFTMSEQRGKVVVLNFWATWCQPCKREIPHFNELYEEYKDEGLEVVIISADAHYAPQELLDDYLNKRDEKGEYDTYYSHWLDYTCTFGRYNEDNDVKGLFEVGDGLPITVVVDREGIIKHIFESSMTLDELKAAVEPVL